MREAVHWHKEAHFKSCGFYLENGPPGKVRAPLWKFIQRLRELYPTAMHEIEQRFARLEAIDEAATSL
ncbi:unnamed protein product [Amoebophrya sp. A25]|nr:unnamed protein product [Amoebophrya sp. A25]|eukprot:GSA25T00027543001.1